MDTNLERAPILVADPGRRRHSLVGRHFRPLELVLCMGYVKIVMIFFVFVYSSFDQASKRKSQTSAHNRDTESASVIGCEASCFTTTDEASSSKKKKTGRGKAKGVARGQGLTLEIYDGM
ncbi:hypothetical protein WN943_025093 [Citrus x changshan-huyou]